MGGVEKDKLGSFPLAKRGEEIQKLLVTTLRVTRQLLTEQSVSLYLQLKSTLPGQREHSPPMASPLDYLCIWYIFTPNKDLSWVPVAPNSNSQYV